MGIQMLPSELCPNNSTVYEIALSNTKNGAPVNDAIVQVKVLKPDGTEIVALIDVPYIPGSNGIYQLITPPIDGLISGITYNIIYDITGNDGLVGQRERKIQTSKAK